jgi:acyl-CoA synthetase (AMP-forming)/AMP-acid ligase II
VASISASEVLGETRAATEQGAGVCVGRRFSGIEWRVVRIVDGPIRTIDNVEMLPDGEIGELIVRGDVVTSEYVNLPEATARAKIADGEKFWHRMGDVGYLDAVQRFWFCGRLMHRVATAQGTMFTIVCEAIFNTHPSVFRSALVGVGPRGQQRPVMIVEPWPEKLPRSAAQRDQLLAELRRLAAGNPRTASIGDFLIHPSFPVDIRHNAKIFREKLAVWAAKQLPAS